MGLLRCFSLAFDKSKTQLKKDLLSKFFQVSRKPQLIFELFSIQAKSKTLLHYDRNKKVGLLCYFSVDFDNSKSQLKKIRHLKKIMQKSEKPQLKEMFFLYTLNQFFLALERKQESPMLRCFSLAFNNSKIPLKKDVLKQIFQISKQDQLIDQLFSIQATQKTFFALGPTQKVGLLRCFSLAFDKSKTQLKKDLLSKFFQVSRKPQLIFELFCSLYKLNQKLFCIMTETKKLGLLCYFSVDFDNSKSQLKKIRHLKKIMQKSEKPQLKEMFFLYTLNQFFLALERKQESPMLRCFSLAFNNSKIPLKKDVLKQFFQISKQPQLIDEFFSIHAKPKTLFALRRTQKVGLLRCFSLAFNSSNISLKKKTF